MKRIFEITMHDNGWSVNDPEGESSVCEEKPMDTRHKKFKRFLGSLVYAELDYFINEHLTNDVRVTMEFEEVE